MNTSPAPLTHKLILGVLSLIAVCLVLIAAKIYAPIHPSQRTAPTTTEPTVVADNTEAVSPAHVVAPRGGGFGRQGPTPGPPSRLSREPIQSADSAVETAGIVNDARVIPPALMIQRSAGVVVVNQSAPPLPSERPAAAEVAGGVAGVITFVGTPLPEAQIQMDPTCGSLRPTPTTTRHYVVGPNGGLANVLVFLHQAIKGRETTLELLERPLVGITFEPSFFTVHLNQIGCMFEPYVLAMETSQTLNVHNSDPVLQNVHFTPKKNREINFALATQGALQQVQFSQAEGLIRVKSDTHPWMIAYISVLPHPFFAVTDANGIYRIRPGLPAGQYQLSTLHPKGGSYRRDITIDPSQEIREDFEVKSVQTGGQPTGQPTLTWTPSTRRGERK